MGDVGKVFPIPSCRWLWESFPSPLMFVALDAFAGLSRQPCTHGEGFALRTRMDARIALPPVAHATVARGHFDKLSVLVAIAIVGATPCGRPCRWRATNGGGISKVRWCNHRSHGAATGVGAIAIALSLPPGSSCTRLLRPPRMPRWAAVGSSSIRNECRVGLRWGHHRFATDAALVGDADSLGKQRISSPVMPDLSDVAVPSTSANPHQTGLFHWDTMNRAVFR
jgi:hypothetical protein